ncbi:hypothetical protein AAA799E16_00381 [Marine Group I thaumarchaeote SCGC AAA799-E16]|uniref:Uncharacterized protein n=2 Tax=Marine Group I TaxID=905826 RepID=A0A087RVX0_9ARCH|nr:hypothetical protein AAA799E16_00381 [Marine Group I thaumarchaeote SCGC AAA799-E16]KFM17624.1 hypothetical protein SCCGRSA3_01554 [Marine Group I thaumarchaeote SCGC RSA3]
MTKDISNHKRMVLEKKEKLREIFEKYFPGRFWVLESCLAVRAILEIKGITLPFMLVLLGPPSAGKSTVISMVGSLPEAFALDSFTPKAFVTQLASKSEDDLAKIDLLKQIEDKIFLTSELASLFSVRDDQLGEIFGILTRVLDGQGFKNSSGAHGKRGYDKIFFVWIGAAVDVPKRVWPIIASMGPKEYFLRIDVEISYQEEQEKILENMHGLTYEQKMHEINECLKEYWDTVVSFPDKNEVKIVWNAEKDQRNAEKMIVQYAQLMARIRGHVPSDDTKYSSGSDYAFVSPIIEDPNRATHALYNFVRGFALCNGRNYIENKDVSAVRKIVLSSASRERVELVKLLIENNGELTSAQLVECRKVSKMTALKIMKHLEILGLVDRVKTSGVTKSFLAIRLKEEFRWILEDKS